MKFARKRYIFSISICYIIRATPTESERGEERRGDIFRSSSRVTKNKF